MATHLRDGQLYEPASVGSSEPDERDARALAAFHAKRHVLERPGDTPGQVLLPDLLRPGLLVVFCGTALGARSAEVGAYYAGRGNQFWATLHAIGLTPRQLAPVQYNELPEYGIGLTDICKTKSGSDQEVGRDEFDVARLIAQLEHHRPGWLAFNGKNAARAALERKVDYGAQGETLGGTPTFVLPSTSGAARRYWDIGPWRELAGLIVADEP